MALTREEVEHVALLSRLALTDTEIDAFTIELNQILEHFESLRQLDTENVEPTAHPVPLANVFRPDRVEPSLDVAAVLANAPDATEDAFKVPRVVEL